MEKIEIRNVLEAAMLAAGHPLSIEQLCALFGEEGAPERSDVRAALDTLEADYAGRGIALKEVASGFRIEVRPTMTPWLARLWEERPPRYSRALMETLAIIAYRQPATRGDVEEVRGVAVSTNIMRTLLERGWIKVAGYRDVPGKPALYRTTREFLDYFGLRRLEDLPPLGEIRDVEGFGTQLELAATDDSAEVAPGSAEPLVRAMDAGLPMEPATVASIAVVRDDQPGDGGHEVPAGEEPAVLSSAEVIPLKAR